MVPAQQSAEKSSGERKRQVEARVNSEFYSEEQDSSALLRHGCVSPLWLTASASFRHQHWKDNFTAALARAAVNTAMYSEQSSTASARVFVVLIL